MELKLSQKITITAVLVALALVLSFVERSIPNPLSGMGVKLGLANVVVVLALYLLNVRLAFSVGLVKSLAGMLLFTGMGGFLYSFAGFLFSFAVMSAAQKMNRFSIIAISGLGGVFFNIGQLLVGLLLLKNTAFLYYFPFLIAMGLITGLMIGLISYFTITWLTKIEP